MLASKNIMHASRMLSHIIIHDYRAGCCSLVKKCACACMELFHIHIV